MPATYPRVVGRLIFSREDLRSWIRENYAVLRGMGMRLNKAVYREVRRALSEDRDDLVAIVPEFDLVDAERLMTELSSMSNAAEHTTTRVRQLFEGVTVLLSDSVEPPVTEISRDSVDESRMELLSLHLERILAKAAVQGDQTLTKRTCRDRMKAALGVNTLDRKDIDFMNDFIDQETARIHRIAAMCVEFMHASTPVPENESQTLPETIGDVVRRAMAHTTFEDICFVHFPREEVPDWLLQAQGIEPASVGVIYTLTRQTLRSIQEECAASPVPSLPSIAWNLNMVPLLPRDIFSVAVQSARGHTRRDSVIEFYVPAQTEATIGMTMVHFFAEDEANAFVRGLRHRAGGA